jgi:Sec-independent protein secretion pathway component TatC
MLNIHSKRFFYSNLTNIFWTYIQLSIYISIIITIPFQILNFLIYFLQILYPKEFSFIIQLFFKFSLIYGLVGFINYYFLIPNILNFFFKFEEKNLYLITHFEAKFDEYFFMVLNFNFKLNLIFQLPVLLDYLIFINFISKQSLYYNKKVFFLLIVGLNTFLNPPEFYIQIIFLFCILLFIEFYIMLQILLKNL